MNIALLGPVDRLKESLTRSLPLMPLEVANEVKKLVMPEALATMAGVLVAWGTACLFGVGEIAAVVLLAVGVAALGGVAWDAGKHLLIFTDKTLNATAEKDLDLAAHHFAQAVSLIGITATMAFLFKQAPKTFGHNYMQPGKPFWTLKQFGEGPRNKPLSYKSSVSRKSDYGHGEGSTSAWGDIEISQSGPLTEKRLALYHELVHSLLTPKIYLLREYRVYLGQRSYSYSHLLRYLEEALAETIARLRVNGFSLSEMQTGIKFPVENGYVTIKNMQSEITGMLLGPINVGGVVYSAFFSSGLKRYPER